MHYVQIVVTADFVKIFHVLFGLRNLGMVVM